MYILPDDDARGIETCTVIHDFDVIYLSKYKDCACVGYCRLVRGINNKIEVRNLSLNALGTRT
jgi:hypothetical protein